MNSLINDYRAGPGKTDPRPDWLLTREFGKIAEENGQLDHYKQQYPDWFQQYDDFKHQNDPGFFGQVGADLKRGYERGMEGVDVLKGGADAPEVIAQREKIAQANPAGRDIQDLQSEPTVLGKLKIAAKNPLDVGAGFAAEGLASSWPIILGALAGGKAGAKVSPDSALAKKLGAGIGAGVGAGAVAYSGRVLSSLQEAGMDLKDPNSIRAYFSNPDLLAKARDIATRNAVPNAVFMGLTEGLAGMFAQPLKDAAAAGQAVTTGAKLGAAAKEVGLQVAGGASSAAGSDVAEGKPIDPNAVVQQGLGALAFAPLVVAHNLETPRARPGATEVIPSRAQPDAVAPQPGAPAAGVPLDQAPVVTIGDQIANEKRRLAVLEPADQLNELKRLAVLPDPSPVDQGVVDWLKSLKLDPATAAPAAVPATEASPAPVAAAVPVTADITADRAAYDALQGQMSKMTPGTPEYNAVQQQSEVIKNRHEGMPPGEVAADAATLDKTLGTPEAPAAVEPPKPATPATRQKALTKISSAIKKNLGNLDEATRSSIQEQLVTISAMDNGTAVPALQALTEKILAAKPAPIEPVTPVAGAPVVETPAAAASVVNVRKQAERYKALRGATKLTPEEQTELSGISSQVTQKSVEFQQLNSSVERTPAQEQQRQALKKWMTSMGHKPTEEVKPLAEVVAPGEQPVAGARTEGFKQGAIFDGYTDLSQSPEVQKATPQDLAANADRYAGDLTEGGRSHNGSARETSTAIALQAPDGSVVMRGVVPVSKTQSVTSVGDSPVKATNGAAVQLMGKGKLKAVDATGSKPVLLTDLLLAGYKPLGTVKFAGEPTFIRENFTSVDDWRRALDLTDKQATRAAESAPIVEAPATPAPTAVPAADVGQPPAAVVPSAPPAAPEAPLAMQEKVAALAKKAGIVEGGPTPSDNQLKLFDKLLKKNDINIGDAAEFLNSKIFATGDEAVAASEAEASKSASGGAQGEAEIQQMETRIIELEKSLEEDETLDSAQRQIIRDEIKELKQGISEAQGEMNRDYRAAPAGWDSVEGDPNNPNRPLNVEEVTAFKRLVENLGNLGLDVGLQRDVMRKVGDELHQAAGYFNRDANIIRIAVGDALNGRLDNFSTLFHEVGHYVMRNLTPEMRSKLEYAALFTLKEMPEFEDRYANDPSNVQREERLVETFARKLAAEGFGQQSTTIAQKIWRTVKALYLRAAIALEEAFNPDSFTRDRNTNELAVEWFENQLKRTLGGDFDSSFLGDLFTLPETIANRVQKFESTSLRGEPNVRMPWNDTLTQPDPLPDTASAAEESLKYRQLPDDDYAKYPDAMARVNVALQKTIADVLSKVYETNKTKDQDLPAFWRSFAGRADLPTLIMEKMKGRFPGSETAESGNLATEAMQGKYRQLLAQVTRKLSSRARQTAADMTQRAKAAGDMLVKDARKYADIERLYKSSEFMDSHFVDKISEMIKGVKKDLNVLPDLASESGALTEAIRQAENITAENGELPAEYERVFKQITDRRIPVFDYMQALAKLDMDFGTMKAGDIWQAIQDHAPESKELRALEQNKPLAIALAALARNSAQEMNLLQLRVATDTAKATAINKELEEIRSASKERIAALADTIDLGLEARTLRERLKRDYVLSRAKRNKLIKQIDTSNTRATQAKEAARAFDQTYSENEKNLGAYSDWEPADGGEYISMQQGDDDKWTAVRKPLKMAGPDTITNAPAVMDDVRGNAEWLAQHQDQQGSRLYNEVARHTTELGLLNLKKDYSSYQGWALMKMLAPIGEKFASSGTAAGKNIQRRLLRFSFIERSFKDGTDSAARKWNKAFRDVVNSSGYANHRNFLEEVYTPLLYAIESEPGLKTDGQLGRFAALKARELMPEGTTLKPDFDRNLFNFLKATKDASGKLRDVAEKNGVYVEDPRIKDPMRQTAGGTSQGVLRKAIDQGWLTVPRMLNRGAVQTVVDTMKRAGWSPLSMAELAKVYDNPNATPADAAMVQQAIPKLFTTDVINQFVAPYMNKPGRPIFKGALDAYGDRPRIDQSTVKEVWNRSGEDVMAFIGNLFDEVNDKPDNDGDRAAFTANTLRTMGALYKMELRLINDGELASRVRLDPTARGHSVMDARLNDIIPPEHFSYLPFDQTSTRTRVAELAFHSAFGRDGKGVSNDLGALQSDLGHLGRQYENIRSKPRAQQMMIAAERGIDLKKAKRAYEMMDKARGWEHELTTFMSGGNQTGARGDSGAALSTMNTVVNAILNQFSTAFWNLVSVGDPTSVYRSLGPQGVGASVRGLGNVFYGTAGSLSEALGLNILKSSEYAKELGTMIESRNTDRLPLSTLVADIGKGGRFQDSLPDRITQVNRAAQEALKKGVNNAKDPQFATFNALWSPLNFFSNQAHNAITTSTVKTFETMLSKGVKYFQDHPEARKAAEQGRFTFTPDHLGMTGPAFFNDKGVFDFFKEKLNDYRMGNLEQQALDAIPKAERGERMLTKDQVLNLGMMALNEISLESNINTRPIGQFNSRFIRWIAPLLGWPLSKMNQVHKTMSEQDGRTNLKTFAKGMGILASWSIPVGIGFSLAMDQWDKDVLKKKSNRRNIDPMAAVPIIGPAYYANSMSNAAAMLERISRAGTYGLGGDLANGLTNTIDPKSGQRDFDLNSRVLVYSLFDNVRHALKNLVSQEGDATYSSVWRPLMMSLGGNGLIQYQQILNNALNLDNSESRVTKRINVGNWIRPAARDANLDLKTGEGHTTSTPVSVQVREMQLAALANDPHDFLQSFRKAVSAAALRGEEDPERYIYAAYMQREPVNSLMAHKPSELELAQLYNAMDQEGKGVVAEAVSLHERYAEMIKPAPKRGEGEPGLAIRRDVTSDINRFRRDMNPRRALFAQ